MADKIPVKAILTAGNTSALGEFNPGDTLGVTFGGTGADNAASARTNLGLGNVDNTSDLNKPISTATQTALNAKEPTVSAGTTSQFWGGDKAWTDFATTVRATVLTGLSLATGTAIAAADSILVAFGKLQKQITNNLSTLTTHTGNVSNPHSVTKAQVGLGSVDNTADADKPISTATQSALNLKADLVSGIVPSSQLPSYVDDVLEYANLAAFPATGESGKIYVALATNKTYRWSGSAYTEISASPGSTDSVVEGSTNLYFTAARVRAVVLTGLSLATGTVIAATDTILAAFGKLQKQISDNLTTLTSHTAKTNNPHAVTKTQVGLGNADNTSDANKPISTATQAALDLKVSKTDAFYVEASSSPETIVPPDLSKTYLSGWVKSSDFNNVFDTSTGKYQPTQAGWYLITSTINFDYGVQTANVLRGEIVLVDTPVSYVSSTVKDGYPVVFVSAIVYLNGTTDYIRIATRQISAGTISDIYGTLRAILLKAL